MVVHTKNVLDRTMALNFITQDLKSNKKEGQYAVVEPKPSDLDNVTKIELMYDGLLMSSENRQNKFVTIDEPQQRFLTPAWEVEPRDSCVESSSSWNSSN